MPQRDAAAGGIDPQKALGRAITECPVVVAIDFKVRPCGSRCVPDALSPGCWSGSAPAAPEAMVSEELDISVVL